MTVAILTKQVHFPCDGPSDQPDTAALLTIKNVNGQVVHSEKGELEILLPFNTLLFIGKLKHFKWDCEPTVPILIKLLICS